MNPAHAPMRARCLALLQARGREGATTDELSRPSIGGHEAPRRVRELRAEGYPVRCERLPSGYWRYWLARKRRTQLRLPISGASA